VMTDMADLPPRFWIEPDQPQTLICGTAHALAQARAAGVPDERLVLTSGMVIRPAFYDLEPFDRSAARAALGLDALRPTGVVLFGGHGSTQMLTIAKALDGVQLLLLCGRNETLARHLRALRRSAPQAVFGFVEDMPAVMRLGDFFIGKPGPGCLSEAVHLGLPVITFRNAWTMPQERYNTDWVIEQGVGRVIASPAEIGAATAALIAELPRYLGATERVDNRAVFEVADVLQTLLMRSVRARPAPVALPEAA
jgi:UDP-N-acetylglucosamine:LPS N-acetylglucosamine transferase